MTTSSSERTSQRILLPLLTLLAAVSLGFAWAARAQDSVRGRIYAVAHVDILPPDTAAGTKLVKQYVADSLKEKGAVRIEAYAQISRVNHLTLVEVWESQQAYDAHLAAEHTRQFRQQIDPMLGSPYDERLHQLLE